MALPGGVPANGRFTARVIGKHFKTCRAADALTKLLFIFSSDGESKTLRGSVQCRISMNDGSVALYDLANDKGVHRTFSDVDTPVKAVAGFAQIQDYDVQVLSNGVWDKAVPANVVTARVAERAALVKLKDKNTATIAAIDAQLALMVGWETGTLAQQNRKAEEQLKRGTVVADSAAIDARIAEIDAA